MGKIKATILKKQDRPVTDPKPPSIRRFKRKDHSSVESARSGRNSRFTPSKIVSLRGLRKSGARAADKSGTFAQVMPEVLVFRFKKKHRPTETVVHNHYSDERKDKTSTRRVEFFTCAVDDSVRRKQMELMVDQKLGKIETKKRKIIRHRIDKQDEYFRFHKHDIK